MLPLPATLYQAMTTKDALAITTSIARSERLLSEGYTFKRLRDGIVSVQGQPTRHKRRTGEVWIDPHGPYTVDTVAGSCTCPGFANRGVCAHLPAASDWLAAWERGESAPVASDSIDKLIALREIGGERFHCDGARVVVFRNWEAASSYWGAIGLLGVCEPIELTRELLASMTQSGRYEGLLLRTRRGPSLIDFGGPSND